jgi:hypothetical protein
MPQPPLLSLSDDEMTMISDRRGGGSLRQRDDFPYLIGCSEMGLKGQWLFMALPAVAIVALAGCATGPLSEPCGGFFLCTNLH